MTFQYGDAIEKYPVLPLDVWHVGPHTLICDDAVNAWRHDQLPIMDVVYTDPPWNDAIRRRFYESAGRIISLDPDDTLAAWFEGFVDMLKAVSIGPIMIEMGQKEYPDLEHLLNLRGMWHAYTATPVYGTTLVPYRFWAGTAGTPRYMMVLPNGTKGIDVVRWVAETYARPGQRFFDPCAGACTFLAPAAVNGAQVWGCEIIPRKLAEGIARLAHVTRQEPWKS